MASLIFTAFGITPTTSSATGAVITIDYTYEITLTTLDVHNQASEFLKFLIGTASAEITSSGIDYANGTVTMSDGTSVAIPGNAEVDVWGDDPGDRDDNLLADDDDKRLSSQDPHAILCKTGTQTFTRSFTVVSRNLDEDWWSQDEIYLHLRVRFPALNLEAESAVVAGSWAG